MSLITLLFLLYCQLPILLKMFRIKLTLEMRDVCRKLQRPYELTEDHNLNEETQERQPAFHGLEDMLLR